MRALNLSGRFYKGLTVFALALSGAAACQNPPTANVNTSTVNGNTQTTVNVKKWLETGKDFRRARLTVVSTKVRGKSR